MYIYKLEKNYGEKGTKYNINEEISKFTLALGIALKNEMVFGKDLSIINSNEKIKNYLERINSVQLENLIYNCDC